MRTRSRCLIAAMLLAMASCKGGDAGPLGPNPSLTGRWTGSAQFGTVDFDATFAQVGGVVTGDGSYDSPLGGANFTVTGSVVGNAVSLVLEAGGIGTGSFTGRFTSDDRVEGRLTAPGSGSMDLTLERS